MLWLTTQFLDLFYPWRLREAMSEETARAFDEQCKARLRYDARLMQGVVLACDLLWWPFDYVVFADFPWRIQALWTPRVVLAVFTVSYLLALRFNFVGKNAYWPLLAAGTVQSWAAGFASGALGGAETPYFHTLYIALFSSVPFPLKPHQRALFNALIAAGLATGHLAANPTHIYSPHVYLGVSFLILSIFLSLAFGHGKFILDRDNFVQAQRLAEQAQLLENRVAARTAELRDLLDSVETARERERRRISRELHDELGQELSALRYSLEFTKVRYEREPSAIEANLKDLESLLRRTAQTTRNLVTELRPRVLDDLGLEAALEWLTERVEERSGVTCSLSVSGHVTDLDERASITAFRVVQEGLTNVVRHAQATRADVSVLAKDGILTVRVEDDGVGIHGEHGPRSQPSTGVGLLGMRERAHALGGAFQVEEGPGGRGTRIECTLPMAPPPSVRAARGV